MIRQLIPYFGRRDLGTWKTKRNQLIKVWEVGVSHRTATKMCGTDRNMISISKNTKLITLKLFNHLSVWILRL